MGGRRRLGIPGVGSPGESIKAGRLGKSGLVKFTKMKKKKDLEKMRNCREKKKSSEMK